MGILELKTRSKETVWVNNDAIKYFRKDTEDSELTHIVFKDDSWLYVVDTPEEIIEKINSIYW